MKYYNPYDYAVTLTAINDLGESYNLKPMPRTNFELLDGYKISTSSYAQYPNIKLIPELNINPEKPNLEKTEEKGNK